MKELLLPFPRLLAASLVTLLATTTHAQWTNGQAASYVIGQTGFNTGASGSTTTTLRNPFDVAIDQPHGKLYVADSTNNRVLRFSYPTGGFTSNGPAAEAVFGQSSFTATGAATSATGMSTPRGICVVSTGTLYVTDDTNARVLIFDNAHSLSSGTSATRVLGQSSFTSNSPSTSASGLSSPFGAVVDGSGSLWVAECAANRVLRYDNISAKASGASADGVLGQTTFTGNVAASDQSHFVSPVGLAFIGQSLFVSADQTNRVLRFDNASSKANGANADGVLGQSTYTATASAGTQSGLFFPSGLDSGQGGRLYVAELQNNRVMIFNNASSKANGANADFVLGQSSFTPMGPGNSAATMTLPFAVTVDRASNRLFVSELGNNRVIQFGASSPLPISLTALAIE